MQKTKEIPTNIKMIYRRDYPEINTRFTGEADNTVNDTDRQHMNAWNRLIIADQSPVLRKAELTGWLIQYPAIASRYGSMQKLRAMVIPGLEAINAGNEAPALAALTALTNLIDEYNRRAGANPTQLDAMADAIITLETAAASTLEADISIYGPQWFAYGDDDEGDTQG